MENELPSDLSIWDERCMKIFIETNSALFRVFASRYVKDIDIIDDFLQEAYIKLWTHRKSIGEVKSLRNYFYTLLYHTILDKQASTPMHKVSIESPEIQEIPSDSSLFHHTYCGNGKCPAHHRGIKKIIQTKQSSSFDEYGRKKYTRNCTRIRLVYQYRKNRKIQSFKTSVQPIIQRGFPVIASATSLLKC